MVYQEERLSEKVIRAVAKKTKTEPLELPPLYDTIDPDHLDSFVLMDDDEKYSFQYAGCCVTVRGDKSVTVRSYEVAVEKLAC